MKLKDKIAIITGGATGIGKAITETFVREGARVMITSRSIDNLRQFSAALNQKTGEDRVHYCPVDVNKREEVESSIQETVKRWGEVHILVNNAGRSGRLPLREADDREWFGILDTNLNGVYFYSKAFLKSHKENAYGRIINISSVLGKFGVSGYTAYCASKHGIVGFSSALALEVAQRGITVNAICPGWVDTKMAEQGISETAKSLGMTPEDFRKSAIRNIPMKRFVDANEVAELALFLCGDEARAITGQAINICGGSVMH